MLPSVMSSCLGDFLPLTFHLPSFCCPCPLVEKVPFFLSVKVTFSASLGREMLMPLALISLSSHSPASLATSATGGSGSSSARATTNVTPNTMTASTNRRMFAPLSLWGKFATCLFFWIPDPRIKMNCNRPRQQSASLLLARQHHHEAVLAAEVFLRVDFESVGRQI